MEALDITATRKLSTVCTPRQTHQHHSTCQVELVVNDAGVIADCNDASEKFFEYTKSDLLGKSISMIIPELAGVSMASRGHIDARLRMLSRIGWKFKVNTFSNAEKMCHLFLSNISLPHDHYIRLVAKELS